MNGTFRCNVVHVRTARTVTAPAGLWRVGRAADPYSTKAPTPIGEDDVRGGNRFDSADGNFSVRYFATLPEACFGETLATMRPSLAMQALVADEWREKGFMMTGNVPADWRHKRLLVTARLDGVFFDVEAAHSRLALEHQSSLAKILAGYGVTHLDVPAIRGADRRVTRHIAQWVHDQLNADDTPTYAGIRYLSRLNTDWECWAVFDRTAITEVDRITITARHPALEVITSSWGIVVH